MSIQTRFEEFHRDNPKVLAELERLAGQWFAAGHGKCAIGMLWEVLRWETGLRTTGESGYRLNDHFRSRYVRLLVQLHPEWEDGFYVRELRSA